ncbi:hypothetical protein UFOVP49_181 [uncultured Caudovirales phage]|uniref:Uncharacterized protein n=1 Tax=uncultured Caudovirales phage TaxID=2100421 RepID=A0A6J5KTL8_9CAUD|nr:hypothetical protein UFOVP49_181 [uncultured Caudovirales phage]
MSLLSLLGEENPLSWYLDRHATNTGKTVGYRRVSGKIGLTNNEEGIRGAWVEKRVALFKSLLDNNYRIKILSELTDSTKNDMAEYNLSYQDCDVLVLEFGGTNLQFYQKYWDKTVEMINAHQGKIIFINDDPDLGFLWELLPNENWSRWTVAANAVNCKEVGETLKCPIGATVVDYPMDGGMEFAEFHFGANKSTVYIGRPNGRTKIFKELTQSSSLVIAGKPEEWKDYPSVNVIKNPNQKDRRSFYQNYAGCLAVYDNKHRICGWRTGRAYHAVYAGIPVCSPNGNVGLHWCYGVDTATQLTDFANTSREFRENIWKQQKASIQMMKKVDLIKL